MAHPYLMHVFHPPLGLPAWPDADHSTRTVSTSFAEIFVADADWARRARRGNQSLAPTKGGLLA
jgi:hypothetical protein